MLTLLSVMNTTAQAGGPTGQRNCNAQPKVWAAQARTLRCLQACWKAHPRLASCSDGGTDCTHWVVRSKSDRRQRSSVLSGYASSLLAWLKWPAWQHTCTLALHTCAFAAALLQRANRRRCLQPDHGFQAHGALCCVSTPTLKPAGASWLARKICSVVPSSCIRASVLCSTVQT